MKKAIPVRTTVRMSATPRLTQAERLRKHYYVCRAGQLESGRQVWRPCGLCKDLLARKDYAETIRPRPSPALLARFADRLADRKRSNKERYKSDKKIKGARRSPGSSKD
jgi:hypothetical protein